MMYARESDTPNQELSGNNKGVALLIAILALFLAFSEMGGNNAEREAQRII